MVVPLATDGDDLQVVGSRDRTPCLKTDQHVKIGREGEGENAGQHDESETLEHFFLLTGSKPLDPRFKRYSLSRLCRPAQYIHATQTTT